MMESNPKRLPLNLAKDLQKLLIEIKKVTVNNSDIAEEVPTDKAIYAVKDRDDKSDFKFLISDVSQDSSSSSQFKIFISPFSRQQLGHNVFATNYDGVLNNYRNWLNIIREYGSISFTQEDDFIRNYSNQFYEYFQIVDEDADTAPLEPHKQVSVLYLLDNIQNVLLLQAPTDEIQNLIEEAQEIKNDVSNLTKRSLGKRISILMAQIWSKRAELGKKIIDTTSKEIMKRGVNYGLDNWDDLLSFLSKFFN